MSVRLDAQLPAVAVKRLAADCGVRAHHLSEFGLREASDEAIFSAASAGSGVALLTKDVDVLEIVKRRGPPPAVILLGCGNRPNSILRLSLATSIPTALGYVAAGQSLLEMS